MSCHTSSSLFRLRDQFLRFNMRWKTPRIRLELTGGYVFKDPTAFSDSPWVLLFFVFDRAVMTIVHRALSSHFLLHTHRLLFETFDSQRQGPGGPSLSSALRTRTFRFSGVILTCLPLL